MEGLRPALSVLLVFALLGVALAALRRGRVTALLGRPWRRPAARSKSLRSLERLALSPQHALHLVQFEGRQLLVATHPRGCTLLTEMAKGVSA